MVPFVLVVTAGVQSDAPALQPEGPDGGEGNADMAVLIASSTADNRFTSCVCVCITVASFAISVCNADMLAIISP